MELLAGLAVVKKTVDAVRYLAGGSEIQWKEAGIVVLSWAVGVGLAFLVAASSLAESVGLGGAGVADVILAGIAAGSSAGVVHDLRDSVDVR